MRRVPLHGMSVRVVGEVIYHTRSILGLTLFELQDRTGVSYAMISRLETGVSKTCQVWIARRLLIALGLTPIELSPQDAPILEDDGVEEVVLRLWSLDDATRRDIIPEILALLTGRQNLQGG